jgi:hypothetical protein
MSTKEKDKNLKNDPQEIQLIIEEIEREACHNNPGPTAEAAAAFIDETYLQIPKESLPTPNFGSLEDAFGPQVARIGSITENVFDGDFDKMRRLGYEYLSMSFYVAEKKQKQEEAELQALRADAWNLIHPHSDVSPEQFDWANCNTTVRNAINAIVDLKRQLAKATEKS